MIPHDDEVDDAQHRQLPLTVLRSEEELQVSTTRREAGRVVVRKVVETQQTEHQLARSVDHLDVERVAANPDTDSGRTETLPDGSLSIPLFEERLVVRTERIVRERIVLRRRQTVEELTLPAELRRERITVAADADVAARVHVPEQQDEPKRDPAS